MKLTLILEQMSVAAQEGIETGIFADGSKRDAAEVGEGKFIEITVAELQCLVERCESLVGLSGVGVETCRHVVKIPVGVAIIASKFVSPIYGSLLVA